MLEPGSKSKPGLTRLSYFVALIISALAGYWLWGFLTDFPDPPGANGYFYLKQTESLANGIGFYFKDRSLAFALPVFIQKFIHNSLLSFQISILITWFLTMIGTVHLFASMTREWPAVRRSIGMLAVTLGAVTTLQVYEFDLTFFKNAFAVMLVLWGVGFALYERKALKLFGAILLLAAFLTHKSMLLVFACLALPMGARYAKISAKKLIVGCAVAALGLTIFALQFERAASYLRALLSTFQTPKAWMDWALRLRFSNLEMLLTLILLVITFVTYLVMRRNLNSKTKSVMDGLILVIVFAIQPFQMPGANGPGYRLFLFVPLFAIGILTYLLLSGRKIQWALPFALILLTSQPFLSTRHLDDVFTPFSVLEEDVRRIPEFVTQADHLTSHHGLEFFVDYVTNIRSRSFINEDPGKRDFRLAYIGLSWLRDPALHQKLQERALLHIGSEYILIEESRWKELREQYRIADHWKNPTARRPAFITNEH